MEKGIVTKAVNFKFGQQLPKGSEVNIYDSTENTFLVGRKTNPTIKFVVRKNLIKLS